MEIVRVPIAELQLDQKNARRGDVQSLMGSLKEFGQHRAVVVQRSTNRVLIGNHMVLAAGGLGWSEVDVVYVDDDDKKAQRRALTDNFVGDQARWDNTQLESLLREMDEEEARALPGIDDRMLDKLLADANKEPTAAEAIFPIVPKPGESYSYVVVLAKDEVDGVWLKEVMGCKEMKSYKSGRVVASRVIDVAMFKKALNRAIQRGEEYR